MNIFNIEKAFKMAYERHWDTIYWLIDLHGTIITPDHDKIEFYPNALEVLKWISDRSDMKIILWTSSYKEEINRIKAAFTENGININLVNENFLEHNTAKVCMDKKFYFNILLDDRAGFEGVTDWYLVKRELVNIDEWCKTASKSFSSQP